MAEKSETNEDAIKISEGILETTELSVGQIEADLKYLYDVLGEYFQRIVGSEINSTYDIYYLHHLAEALKFFEENESLEKLIDRFESDQEAYSHIPTLFFASRILGDSAAIEFEPERGDILLDWEDESVTFEFKRPRISEEAAKYWEQHREILDEVESILDDDFQYTISYDKKGDFHQILPQLISEADSLNSPGRARLANTIEVDLQETEGFNDEAPIRAMIMPGKMMDKDTGNWSPMTTYASSEATFSIAGPKVDETEKLADLISGARKQLTSETPNVIVIYTGDMLDSFANLVRATQDMFKSTSNTRINAVVLWEYNYSDSGEIEVTSRPVRNPFASSELPNGVFELLPYFDQEVVTN